MAQSSITNYFSKRKRATAEDVKIRSKVLLLNEQDCNFLSKTAVSYEEEESKIIKYKPEPVLLNQESIIPSPKGDECEKQKSEGMLQLRKNVDSCKVISAKASGRGKKKVPKKNSKNAYSKSLLSSNQSDIRELFKKVNVDNLPREASTAEDNNLGCKGNTDGRQLATSAEKPPAINIVPFELKGTLSPKKTKADDGSLSASSSGGGAAQKTEVNAARKELGLMTPRRLVLARNEDLSLKEIKAKLSRTSRLAELRESIKKFNKGAEQLDRLEEQRKVVDVALSPKLKEFQAIEVEVPVTPQKGGAFGSPEKLLSPRKGPAYQSFSPLAKPGVPALALPYTYRFLAEVFRCMDTVTSMLHNRKETVTFNKLKPAVQEMLRRNFTENHLGQIKRVHPDLFTFKREKCRSFGSSKPEMYELVVEPQLEVNSAEQSMMTPSCLLERRRAFHARLLELVKDYHEEFLLSLDPPMVIPRSQLTRWHPEFELEKVPCVEADSLPQPPTVEKYTTAKDVLDRAKTLFNCNHRMEQALQKASEELTKKTPTTPTKQSCSSEPSTSPLFKGLPKSLVDKIRAKQAAKALLAMTRTPVQEQEAIQYIRLPEIARILRTLYVAEKKSVLPLEWVLEKLGCSYRERLSRVVVRSILQLKIIIARWEDVTEPHLFHGLPCHILLAYL
ncbi:DNA replication factor Cdt1 isoform X2 [Anabrus simplex]|uniref:DNA replication factor Cdt1 isoform X2 n=1 Tax=Anabrus simplex TaxID=316456 RepID=UPI0035A2F614